MSDSSEDLAALSPERRRLVELLLRQEEAEQVAASRADGRQDTDYTPLSFAQQRLWFLDQLQPGSPLYNLLAAVRLSGELDVKVLAHSLNEVVRRHAALRTVFTLRAEAPVQAIIPTLTLALPCIDLAGLSEAEQAAEVQRQIREEAHHPFDLALGPLVRTILLRLAETEHVLLLNIHHIVCDRWSQGILIQECAALYEARMSGRPAPLADLPLQYADYASWQREWLKGPVGVAQLSYWKRQLARLPTLHLPTDRPRPAVQTASGAQDTLTLPRHLTEALKALSKNEGVTLFMTLLAAFQVLLSRYTGQTDIAVGSPIANRNRVEFERLIGLLINVVGLRTDLSGNPSFRDVLRRVREVTLEAYAHQDLPFEQVVEALQPARDLSRPLLFPVMFAFQNAQLPDVALAGLTLTPLEIERGLAPFDLTLLVLDAEPDLRVTLEYNTDLFEPATIRRMARHLQVLLEGVVADPEQRLADLPVLTAAERRQLLVEWNATQAEYPQAQCVHELIAAQAARMPEAVALVFEDQHVTYRELNRRANQLAHYLRRLGVGPEVLVGLCLERSVEMMIGMLGVLKAGGAYVPLDPAYPRERMIFMLADSRAPVLLTQEKFWSQLHEQSAQVICMDRDWAAVAQAEAINPSSGVRPDHLAYTIYTSGSTGRPKGVSVSHRSLVNCLTTMRWEPGLSEQDILLSLTSLSFDIAGLELYLPLVVGARLVIAPREVARAGPQLRQALLACRATVVQATPATWRLLLQAGGLAGRRLKMLCGGEAMPRGLADELLGQGGELWNLYGPTETTIWSTRYRVASTAGLVLIGRPIANTRLYILDVYLQPVPVGVPGELYIGGVGLARGYLYRPELTAEKFVPDPFGAEPGARMYRTGDLARYQPDGNVEFLGRTDYQVKIRGFRVEPREIEARLTKHAAVQEAVVSAHESLPGDWRLVAYVVPNRAPAPMTEELRNWLQRELPEYMVPSAFVPLQALPLTANGKVDRGALPAPDGDRPLLTKAYVAPRTPMEATLARLWAELLGLERVGVEDDFFSLGGHSLLATQVVARVRQMFQVELPLRMVFEGTFTVAVLAQAIAQEQIKQAGEEDVATLLTKLNQLSDDEVKELLSHSA